MWFLSSNQMEKMGSRDDNDDEVANDMERMREELC